MTTPRLGPVLARQKHSSTVASFFVQNFAALALAFLLGYVLRGTASPAVNVVYPSNDRPLDPSCGGLAAAQARREALAQGGAAAGAVLQTRTYQTGLGQQQDQVLAGQAASGGAGTAGEEKKGRIPRILHHVFITTDPANAGLSMWPQHVRWVEACKYHFSPAAGWKYMYWDAAATERLIADKYPFFLDFYRTNVTKDNERSDVARYLVLDQFGGLYLDSDTECWREASDMLEGYDVILQGTHEGEGVGSAAIASVPAAPVWGLTLQLMLNRSIDFDSSHPDWYRSLEFTGPNLLRDALIATGLEADDKKMFQEQYSIGGLVYRVYRGGSWFLACQWWEDDCRRRVYVERAKGETDLSNVVGMHRFAGSWIEEKKDGKGVPETQAVKRELYLQLWRDGLRKHKEGQQ